MKRLFYLGLIGLALFEISKVYFIMPMPGSQRIDSLQVAYFLHHNRWVIRAVFAMMIVVGARAAFRRSIWKPAVVTGAAAIVVWMFNFKMTAEVIFKQPKSLVFLPRSDSKADKGSIVIGVAEGGQAKAYPIRFLAYHHQIQDTIAGKPVLITYCNVCRTGRVFRPIVNGKHERFRLVGMDHFNAMLEDETTKSWWRQATGEAVAGPLKGTRLEDVKYSQLRLERWFQLNPNAVVMQADQAFLSRYDSIGKFERGESKGRLTHTDSSSWSEKSWVVGVEIGTASKAYDWNRLEEKGVINDQVGETPIVVVLAKDRQGFAVFQRAPTDTFVIQGDSLSANGRHYDFLGRDLADSTRRLERINGSQEFWHSWRTFHSSTQRYP